ncbi:DUF937 domain-containing protein [Xylanimonas protaetiae]|uniref:DUF937 domain-containing protein n=1 Tax=Xylanimonas protaetiae TaxID=2509457 RepID=A0A4P6F4A2_9MICO|nr:DUF937 domain-containing protein [Xylanimonas protaetiae]QAY70115.1 DUF937 domain-containing protein [Xylanimonas protaetiae]
MAGLDDLLTSLPLDQIAGKLGVDAGTVQSAAGGLLPAILGGLKANADDPAGAASLQEALTQHSPQLVEGGINIDDVDTDDGDKIAGHIFGDQKDAVVAKVAETTGQQPNILSKLLPALAPIAMSFIAKQLQGKQQAAAPQAAAQEEPGGLGGLLGGLLGGGGSGGGGLDIGGLLGGLGGLLGGGRR